MKYYEAKAIVEKLTYKPGWRIVARDDHTRILERGDKLRLVPAVLYVDMTLKAPSSIGACGDLAKVKMSFGFATDALFDFDRDYFLRELRTLLHKMECHETDEWLRLDGVLVTEPHPDLEHSEIILGPRP